MIKTIIIGGIKVIVKKVISSAVNIIIVWVYIKKGQKFNLLDNQNMKYSKKDEIIKKIFLNVCFYPQSLKKYLLLYQRK